MDFVHFFIEKRIKMSTPNNERQVEFKQLLEELSQGSDEAASRIVDLYSTNILRVIRRSLPRAIRPKIDSVDIFQSVWMSILAKRTRLAQLDTPQRFIAYLAATARLKVLEKYRHFTRMQAFDVKREQRMSDPIDACNAKLGVVIAKATFTDVKHPPASAVAQAREAWQKIISNCNERDQQIVELRLKGQTYETIANELNVSTRTIRRTLQRLLLTVTNE